MPSPACSLSYIYRLGTSTPGLTARVRPRLDLNNAFAITAPGGRFSAHGAPSGAFARIDPREAGRRQITVRGVEQAQFRDDEHARLARSALARLAAGQIRPYIGQTFPLAKAADAHAAIEARATTGKTLLTLS
jgi:NADPH:quinone reductase